MDDFQGTITKNRIPETQLAPKQLKRLAAQRKLYSDAKVIQAVQIGISALGPPILALSIAFLCLDPAYAASAAIIVTLLNIFWLTPMQQSLKRKAAKIQELFDCDVLELSWRELTVGTRLEMETVEKYASKYKRIAKYGAKLTNWYPKDVGKVPLHIGRLVCQRSNCWWDAQLRRRYAKYLIAGFLMVLIVVASLAFIGGLTLDKIILAIVNPLMPTFVIGIRQYKGHTDSATRLDKLKEYTEQLWKNAVGGENPDELTRSARELQDEIYNHRRTSPLIFDWLYNLLRRQDEELMNRSAEDMVKEALESLVK